MTVQPGKVLLLVGPTASGKTRLSLEIAKRCEAEIVSADSRQVYRYLDIGTDKPDAAQREGIPHHCIDIKDPDEFFSAGEYAQLARRIIDEIFARKHVPVVVGGSGLYIRALVDGVFSGKYRDDGIRRKLKLDAAQEGLDNLYRRLIQVDPVASQKIHANDSRRIIRALEVYTLTGEPISKIQKERTLPANFHSIFWALRWDRDVIYRRIDARVDRMIQSGLIEEVQRLLEMGYDTGMNSLDSVGYKEVLDYLSDRTTIEETVDSIKQNTRRFAKKQMTWFRRDSRIRWIDVHEPVNWDRLAKMVIYSLK